ncbi:hypothetical protein CB0940_07293 [Cercospora beticola]|uniref:AA1-like domain-containing protein n=1 Tax=Cercospora beticola TaxID=122368 RepID=A0A2G5H7C4_CERBT|nr:hypothetical protein CB0940_07293 [Cercospora beticola]PIA88430.1 hypothetical protein CB0940_07293 [Cercospora beticola]WPB03232.1 hypothetical protein RHO25_007869 [Cercospora beticola]CAK1358049.1 unnamed protein product [Cercospora beticola]
MYYSTILAASLASIAAAAPAKRESYAADLPGTFEISNFVFGCTVGCNYNFDLTVSGSAENHPAVAPTYVKCSGDLESTDYVQCGDVSETQRLYAYIEKDTNELHLQYEVQNYNTGAIYRYYGEEIVYAATSEDADKQEECFEVKENRATGVL